MNVRRILLGATALLALPAAALGAELTGYLTSKNVAAGTFVVDSAFPMSAGSGVDLGALELGRRIVVTYDGPETAMVASAVSVVPASIAAPPAPAAPAEAPVAAAEPAAPAPPAPAAPEPAAPAPAAPPEVAQAAPAPGAASTASYTAEQADRGEAAYTAECSGCHGTTLGGGGEAPGLLGAGFRNRLIPDGDAAALYAVIATTMPQQAPGTLSPETYADITAFLMERHQIAPGASEFAPPQ